MDSCFQGTVTALVKVSGLEDKGKQGSKWEYLTGRKKQGEKSENFQYQNDHCIEEGSCLLYTCKADRHIHGRNQQEDGFLKNVFIFNWKIIPLQ